MSKILKNNTATPVSVLDTGITIPASGQYTIPSQDFLIWAASDNVITFVSDLAVSPTVSTLTVNDGSSDLSISDGIDLIKGIFPKKIGVQDGSNNDITSTVIGSIRGLDQTPIKYAPHSSVSGSISSLGGFVSASSLDGFSTAGIVISGTWVGLVSFEGSIDGTTFVPVLTYRIDSGVVVSSSSTNGSFRINISGLKSIRAITTLYTSGTIAVSMQLTTGAGFVRSISNLIGVDGTLIGNIGDRVKVDALVSPFFDFGVAILRQNEVSVTTKTETDLPSSTYTVSSNKTFKLTSFSASYDTQAPMYVRLKKQTGGMGAFNTLFRITLKQHGQDESNSNIEIPLGINVGTASDVFKITYESALSRGTVWAGFTGIEF